VWIWLGGEGGLNTESTKEAHNMLTYLLDK